MKKTFVDTSNYNIFLSTLSKNMEKNKKTEIETMLLNPSITGEETVNILNYLDENEYKEELKIPKIIINEKINNINDLLDLIDKYPNQEQSYNINIKLLHKIKNPLIELKNMIGMKELKENIVDQILYYIQKLHKTTNKKTCDYLHTILYGPPGTGKTEVAKILSEIYLNLDILNKNIFKKVTRSDLIAGYLGQTAIKTKEVIRSCLGGVLFIDEAYSLGNAEKGDVFSKECIDTLCECLSDYKNQIMVIVAGYENELNECFFSLNQGLKSRFIWNFKIEPYDSLDLYNIFIKTVKDYEWKINEKDEIKNIQLFKKHLHLFKNYGRDIEILFTKIKICHSRRVFCADNAEKTIVTFEDIYAGIQLFRQNMSNNTINKFQSSLYI